MSYARWSDRSDVYLYPTDNALECCFCRLYDDCWTTTSVDKMLRHLDEHEAVGDLVPADARTALDGDRAWLAQERIAT